MPAEVKIVSWDDCLAQMQLAKPATRNAGWISTHAHTHTHTHAHTQTHTHTHTHKHTHTHCNFNCKS